jgi:hypothetical protein
LVSDDDPYLTAICLLRRCGQGRKGRECSGKHGRKEALHDIL